MSSKAELVYKCEATLGEGPVWNHFRQELAWVDVLEGKLFFYSPLTGNFTDIEIGTHIGCIALCDPNTYILGLRDGIARFDVTSKNIVNLNKFKFDSSLRLNDGAVDSRGRFLVGSMKYDPTPDSGKLYSFEFGEEAKILLEDVGISNGICWNGDSTKMFFIDSLKSSVDVFEYDLENGTLSNRKTFFRFREEDGTPDGMTIDEAGNLYVAMWNGGQVIVIGPNSEIINRIELPVKLVTSVAFGGKDLNTLFITTARYELSQDELSQQPLAGDLFQFKTDATGRLENSFNLKF